MVVKELVALLGIKTDEKSQKKAEGGMNKLIGLAKLAAAAFVAIKVVKWLKGTIQAVATLGDRFDKMSKKSGVATLALQELEHAAELSGASLGDIDTGLKKLQASQVEAADGVATYADEFKRMGVEVKDAQGNFKDTTDLLVEIADGMQGLDTDAERTAVAMKLLGRSGVNLIPMLKEGSGALREMMDEMSELGGIMDKELIQLSADYIDNQRRMNVATRGVKNAIAKEMLPQINKLTDSLIKWWKENGKIIRQRIGEFFGRFGRVIFKNVKFFGSLLRTVVKFVRNLSPLQKGILGVTVAVIALGAALKAGPIGKLLLFAGIIALLVEDFQTFKEGGESAFGAVLKKAYEFLGLDPEQANYDQWLADIKFFASSAGDLFGGAAIALGSMFEEQGILHEALLRKDEKAIKASLARSRVSWDEAFASIARGMDKLFGVDFPDSTEKAVKAFARWWRGVGNWFRKVFITNFKNDIINLVKWLTSMLPRLGTGKTGAKLPPGPKLEGAGALIGGGGAVTAPGAVVSTTSPRMTSKTDIKIDIQAAPGMSEEKMGWEVGRQVSKAIEGEYRTAMRTVTPEPAPG